MHTLFKVSHGLLIGNIKPYSVSFPGKSRGNYTRVVGSWLATADEVSYNDAYFAKLEDLIARDPNRYLPIASRIYQSKGKTMRPEVKNRFKSIVETGYKQKKMESSRLPAEVYQLQEHVEASVLRKFLADMKTLQAPQVKEKLDYLKDVLDVSPDNWEAFSELLDNKLLVRKLKDSIKLNASNVFDALYTILSAALQRKTIPHIDLTSVINKDTIV